MRKTASRLTAAAVMAAALTLGLTASAVTAAGATSAVPPARSALATICYGVDCHGFDPAATRGPDGNLCTASTVTGGPTGNGLVTVWNRYSNNCNANWGRAQLTPQAVADHYSMQVEITTRDSSGKNEVMCYPTLVSNTGNSAEPCDNGTYGGGSVAYTDMVDGTNLATACARVYNNPNSPPIAPPVCVSL
jgi:hypothetical protein